MRHDHLMLLTVTAVLLLAGCAPAGRAPLAPSSPTASATVPLQPSATPSPSQAPTLTATSAPPFFEAWSSSPHADASAPAFAGWQANAPAGGSASCARCHSTAGLLAWSGVNTPAAPADEFPAPDDSLVDCQACHNEVIAALEAVRMPSGALLAAPGGDAACMLCHQGAAAGADLQALIHSLAPEGISPALEFIDVHASPAAATRFGAEAAGGFQFPGRVYAGRFEHAPGFDGCSGCHDPHSLELRAAACGDCHAGIATVADVRSMLRVSTVDYDGDGSMDEGLALELETYRQLLLAGIEAYAERDDQPIEYDPGQPPFFFSADGTPYRAWTPLLLEAAYNLHYTALDAGAYAHNPTYVLQLLYDSLERIGADTTGLVRP